MKISAVVLTKNEEKNIEKCLAGLSWCDEIVVVDDYSEDETLNIIKNLKIKMENDNLKLKIFQRNLGNNFAGQRNFGLSKASGDWVLFVDADERVTKELVQEIQSFNPSTSLRVKDSKLQRLKGFYIKRKDFMWGREMKFGETGDIKLLRLARKNSGKWEREVHEVWNINGVTNTLNAPLLHFPHPDVAQFVEDVNNYSDLNVSALQKTGKKTGFLIIFLWPLCKFSYNFVIKKGFLDGTRGFIAAVMMSFHSFLSRSKL